MHVSHHLIGQHTEFRPIAYGNIEHQPSCMTTTHRFLPDYYGTTDAQITTPVTCSMTVVPMTRTAAIG